MITQAHLATSVAMTTYGIVKEWITLGHVLGVE